MGNFLSNLQQITQQKQPITNPLLNISLSKLREFYGSFKSVCDTYSIDLTEYDSIFSSNETSFKIWDTDQNGFIDALELFSGLILFAESNFEAKVRFLFDIFDFNELNVLSVIDLQFMINSCCNATYKIYGADQFVDEEEVGEFLSNYFSNESEIYIKNLISFTKKVQETFIFCKCIDKLEPEKKADLNIELLEINSYIDDEDASIFNLNFRHEPQQIGMVTKQLEYKSKRLFMESMLDKLHLTTDQQKEKNPEKDVQTHLNWVFGFKCRSVKQPLVYQHTKAKGEKAESQKILYFTGCIAIVYFPKLYIQKHYIEHDYEIISIAQAKKNSLVATGELAPCPSLHIWDSNTLQNYGVINQIHRNGIHLIQFFKDDNYIVSCGMRENSQVLIHNVKDLSLVLSTYISNFATGLHTINNYALEDRNKKPFSFYKTQIRQQQLLNQSQNTSVIENQHFDYDKAFLVCGDNQFILFLIYDGNFLTNEFDLEMYDVKEQLTCATIYRVPKNNYENTSVNSVSDQENSIIIATGHKGGEVILWENLEIQHKGKFYQDQDIVQITTFEHGLIIADSAGLIHIWDFLMQNNQANFDINIKTIQQDNFQLINQNIYTILGYQSLILMISDEGDLVLFEAILEDNKITNFQLTRNNFVTKLKGVNKAMCILEIEQENYQDIDAQNIENNKLLYCVSVNANPKLNLPISIVYGFSLEMHQIVSMWEYEDIIISIDGIYIPKIGPVFALGSLQGFIYLRMENLEETKLKNQKYEGCINQNNIHENGIIQLKFSPDSQYLVALSANRSIYVFQFQNNSYFNRVLSKELEEKKEIPINFDFLDDQKSIIVGTRSRNQYKIELPNLKLQKNLTIQDQEKINCTVWNLLYPITKDYNPEDIKSSIFQPTILGSDVKILLMADHSGYIYFWKNKDQLKKNSGGFLRGHASNINQLLMIKDQSYFYTLGENDNTLLEWKISYNQQEQYDELALDNSMELSGQYNKGQKKVIFDMPSKYLEIQLDNLKSLNDPILLRELIYCHIDKKYQISQNLYDQFLHFSGINDKQTIQLFKNQLTQQAQVDYVDKRPPSISISIDYVHGFQCYDKRNTLHYVHKYFLSSNLNKESKKDIANRKSKLLEKKLGKNQGISENHQSILIPKFLQKEMLYAKRSLLPYQDIHEECQRHFVYFVSRIAIIYNPLTNKQQYYQGHRYKISCIAVHPMKFFVATGEISRSPTIHIWNCLNCQTFKILQTHHSNGIYHLVFSRDASLIISLGMDKQFSIQVTNWKSEQILAFRNTGNNQIFDIQFNPYDKYEFVTAGKKNLTFWQIEARNLLRKNVIQIEENYEKVCCLTCIQFLNYSLGEIIQSDLIAGNNNGDIILVVSNRYIIAKEKAHQSMINCLKVIELFKDKVLIISAGEDECVKIWDTQFNLINTINIRKNTGFFHNNPSKSINLSPQSIDIFACKYPKKKSTENIQDDNDKDSFIYPILLIGTRNGDVIEASFFLEYTGLKFQQSKLNSQKTQLQNQQNDDESSCSDSNQSDNSQSSNNSSDDNDENKQQDLKLAKNAFRQMEQYGQQDIFKFNYQIYIQGHSSQIFDPKQGNKKVKFCLHPKEKIMITIGEDNKFMIHNLHSNKILLINNLNETPTAVKYSPCGRFFVIGFINGNLQLYSTKFDTQKGKNNQNNYNVPILEQLDFIEEKVYKNPVLQIKFSQSYKQFAVSFSYSIDNYGNNIPSFVKTFKITKNDLSDYPRHQTTDIFNRQHFIEINKESEYYKSHSNQKKIGVKNMIYTQDDRYLILYYQVIENSLLKDNLDSQGFFEIRDLQTTSANIETNFELIFQSSLEELNFPNKLLANYFYYNNLLLESGKNENISRDLEVPVMSIMSQFENSLLCGSQRGDLHFVKYTCLFVDDEAIYDNNQKEFQNICLAKSFAAHYSPVEQLQLNFEEDILVTSGQTDECIIKWNFKNELPNWDYDNFNYDTSQERDPFNEVYSQDQFKNLINLVLHLRQEVFEAKINANPQYYGNVKTELKMINILGRKAFSRHNNLLYDFDERLIYTSGCNLVLHYIKEENNNVQGQNDLSHSFSEKDAHLDMDDEEDDNDDDEDDDDRFMRQEFLILDQTPESNNAEISCFSLSKDKKLIVAGTIQFHAKILIWDICSRTCLKTLTLSNCSIIQEVKFAYDNRHIVVLGITNEHTMMLYLIDSYNNQVLGCSNFHYSIPYKIKDIEIFPNSAHKFVACGVQYMSIWNLEGQILTYRNLEIEKPINPYNNKLMQDFQGPESEEDDDEKLSITFTNVIFVNGTILTAGDNGFLYVWDDQRIVKDQNSHPGYPILSLNSGKENNFVSGGGDGKVIIWALGSSEYSYIIEKVYEYDICFNLNNLTQNNPEQQIQSVCIGSKYILAGTRSGDIYEISKPDINDLKSTVKVNKDLVKLRYNCSDHQQPKAIAFSGNSKKFYTITQNGLFSVWDTKTCKRLFKKNFDQLTHSMISCKKSQYIIIAFEQEVIFLDSSKTRGQDPYPQYQKTFKYQAKIADIKLSYSEEKLAVALDPNKEQNAKIELYKYAKNPNIIFEQDSQISNITTSIQFIDFSTDNFFLLYKDTIEEVQYIDLSNNQERKYFYTEFETEWCTKGIQVSSKTKGVIQYYSDDLAENKITNILKLNEKTIAVTDEIGTIRIFNYPCVSGSDQGYMACYTNHLNYINSCILSPDKKYLLTSSETDKSIIIWRIQQFDNTFYDNIDDGDDVDQLNVQSLDNSNDNNSKNNNNKQNYKMQNMSQDQNNENTQSQFKLQGQQEQKQTESSQNDTENNEVGEEEEQEEEQKFNLNRQNNQRNRNQEFYKKNNFIE